MLLAVVLGLAGVAVLTAGPVSGVDQVEPDGAVDENTTFGTTVYTGTLDPGTYYYEVVTDDDSETLQITVGGS